MKGYLADIEHITEENTKFRKVLYTGKHLQLVLMTRAPVEATATLGEGSDPFCCSGVSNCLSLPANSPDGAADDRSSHDISQFFVMG